MEKQSSHIQENSPKKPGSKPSKKTGKGKKGSKGRKGRKRRKIKKIKVSGYGLAIIFAFLFALAALIAKPHIKDRYNDYRGCKVPVGYYCYGIDISKYQPDIEWKSLMVMTDAQGRTTKSITKAKNIKKVSYVFIKATEGTSMKDKHFKTHWKNAGKHDIRRGAYHFFRSSKDARQQALHFIQTVGPLSEDDLPPVLDIETIHKGCSRKTLNEKALIWLRTVENHYGRKPIVYSSASFIERNLYKEIRDNYPIWVAHYGAARPRCEKWHIWQFADNATVYGIDGEVDLNVTTEQTLRKL
jgi:lysozyme